MAILSIHCCICLAAENFNSIFLNIVVTVYEPICNIRFSSNHNSGNERRKWNKEHVTLTDEIFIFSIFSHQIERIDKTLFFSKFILIFSNFFFCCCFFSSKSSLHALNSICWSDENSDVKKIVPFCILHDVLFHLSLLAY